MSLKTLVDEMQSEVLENKSFEYHEVSNFFGITDFLGPSTIRYKKRFPKYDFWASLWN